MKSIVTLSQYDWSLHRKGKRDQYRHRERVDEAIKENLPEIIADESIITSDGKKIVKVPVRSLDEYRFVHDKEGRDQVGQGPGDSKTGDVIGRTGKSDKGKSAGPNGGDEDGEEYYEAYVDIEQLAQMVFADLELPDLQDKQVQELLSEAIEFRDIRRKGPFSNLDKRRTIRENLKRNAQQGDAHFGGITDDDLRYKTYQESYREQSNAVVFAIADVSASMGEFEKYICRSFFWWMVLFLRDRYTNVQIVFISHHTQAKVVTESEFFNRGESGGTMASSAFKLMLQEIEQNYSPSSWNIYGQYFGDGDNFTSDNETCVELINKILPNVNQFGFGEIRASGPNAMFKRTGQSDLFKALQKVEDKRLIQTTIQEKSDVWNALKKFFSKREG
jgi:uncharacterized protein